MESTSWKFAGNHQCLSSSGIYIYICIFIFYDYKRPGDFDFTVSSLTVK